MNYDNPELRDRLASEYVLGTLQGRARRRFQRLMHDDRGLQAAVDFWEAQLTPMAAPLSVPQVSPELWKRIEARTAPHSRDVEDRRSPLARLVARWLDARLLGSLAAGLFLGVSLSLVVPRLTGPTDVDMIGDRQIPASYAGILNDSQGHPAMLISSRRHGRIVDIKVLRPIGHGEDQVLLLWALPASGAAMLLGEVPAQGKGSVRLQGTSEELLANVTELAVSVTRRDEPAPQPGGFILRGPCAKFW